MKGVIFTELAEMVRSRFGLKTLDELIGEINSATEGAYTSVGTYPDQELYDLVAALGRKMELSADELLREFGRYLFGRLASRYPAQVEHASDCFGLLDSLDSVIHPNVQKLYSDAVLPRFTATRVSDDILEMNYQSPRGLLGLAIGLIEGCGAWFEEQLDVQVVSHSDDRTQAVFRIHRQG